MCFLNKLAREKKAEIGKMYVGFLDFSDRGSETTHFITNWSFLAEKNNGMTVRSVKISFLRKSRFGLPILDSKEQHRSIFGKNHFIL